MRTRGLWGKAQTYFEASLALDDHWRAHVALGEMLGRLGRDEAANGHLASALKLALAELKPPAPLGFAESSLPLRPRR